MSVESGQHKVESMIGLNILFVKDGQDWSAQCLEYDLAGQGPTIKDAMVELQNIIVSEVAYSLLRNKPMLDGIPAAPQYYWKLFEGGASVVPPQSSPIKIEGLELPPAFTLPKQEYRVA